MYGSVTLNEWLETYSDIAKSDYAIFHKIAFYNMCR